MSEITSEDFANFKSEVLSLLGNITAKVDRLLDPESGVFAKINIVDRKADKAHDRLDTLGTSYEKMKVQVYGNDNALSMREEVRLLNEHRTKVSSIVTRVAWTISTPILAGIGYLIWSALNN